MAMAQVSSRVAMAMAQVSSRVAHGHGASERGWAPQTTSEIPKGVQKPSVNETELMIISILELQFTAVFFNLFAAAEPSASVCVAHGTL